MAGRRAFGDFERSSARLHRHYGMQQFHAQSKLSATRRDQLCNEPSRSAGTVRRTWAPLIVSAAAANRLRHGPSSRRASTKHTNHARAAWDTAADAAFIEIADRGRRGAGTGNAFRNTTGSLKRVMAEGEDAINPFYYATSRRWGKIAATNDHSDGPRL